MKKSELIKLITEVIKEDKNHATINDISEVFQNFYDGIDEISKYLDDETKFYLKKAFGFLNQAWASEAEIHGVEFTNITPAGL